MELRPELEPQLEVAEKLLPRIFELISLFDDGFDSGGDEGEAKMASAISQISSLTNQNITAYDLYEYWGYTTQEDLAFSLSIPEGIRVDSISNEELIEIINRIINTYTSSSYSKEVSGFHIGDYNGAIAAFYNSVLDRNFSHPAIRNLFGNLGPAEEIADKILAHKPIQL